MNFETSNPNIETELAKAREEIQALRESNAQKTEFVSLATHQIRGPLGAIRGYISLIIEGDYGQIPESLNEPLNIIFKSVDSLGKTVNDYLDVTRMEQGGMRYYRKDFDLSHLTFEAVSEMRMIIEGKGLELRLNISAEVLTIHGDKAKIKHILLNLLDNACKYTKNGWIEVSLNQKDSRALFCVRDTGVGIKPETIPLLFQKFSRDTEANKTNIHGTGLGLYVAKKMVEAQNGRIWAESEGEDKGSQFYVELDLIDEPAKAPII